MTPKEIRAARTGLGWTQAQLAEKAGVHPKAVAYWERSNTRDVKHAPNGAVPRIAEAFRQQGVVIDRQLNYRAELQKVAADLPELEALRMLIEAKRLTSEHGQPNT